MNITRPSDTPRSDARSNEIGMSGVDWHYSATLMLDFARQLERELSIARKALKPFAAVHDAYEANELDDVARKYWGLNEEQVSLQMHKDIELYQGRGGKQLITLQDCDDAKHALTGITKDT